MNTTTQTNIEETNEKRSKMSIAMDIYREQWALSADDSLRQRCIALFQTELDQQKSTAETYYNLCATRVKNEQKQLDERVLASKRQRKYSAVRTINASSDVAKEAHYFFKKKEAEQFAENFNYAGVVPGIIEPGQVASF